MNTEIIEKVALLTDEQLLDGIKLGSGGFQEGVYEIYVNEGKKRRLEFVENYEVSHSLTRFNCLDFISSIKKDVKLYKPLKAQLLFSSLSPLLVVVCAIMIRLSSTTNMLSYPNLAYLNIIILNISSIVIIIAFIMKFVYLFKYVTYLNLVSDKTIKVTKSDLIFAIFLPFLGFLFRYVLISELIQRLKKIQLKKNDLTFFEGLLCFLKSIVFFILQDCLLYVLYNEYTKEIEKIASEKKM